MAVADPGEGDDAVVEGEDGVEVGATRGDDVVELSLERTGSRVSASTLTRKLRRKKKAHTDEIRTEMAAMPMRGRRASARER